MAATSPERRRPSGVMTAIVVCPATAWATVATRPSPTTTPTAWLSASPQPLASTATVDAAGSCARSPARPVPHPSAQRGAARRPPAPRRGGSLVRRGAGGCRSGRSPRRSRAAAAPARPRPGRAGTAGRRPRRRPTRGPSRRSGGRCRGRCRGPGDRRAPCHRCSGTGSSRRPSLARPDPAHLLHRVPVVDRVERAVAAVDLDVLGLAERRALPAHRGDLEGADGARVEADRDRRTRPRPGRTGCRPAEDRDRRRSSRGRRWRDTSPSHQRARCRQWLPRSPSSPPPECSTSKRHE